MEEILLGLIDVPIDHRCEFKYSNIKFIENSNGWLQEVITTYKCSTCNKEKTVNYTESINNPFK